MAYTEIKGDEVRFWNGPTGQTRLYVQSSQTDTVLTVEWYMQFWVYGDAYGTMWGSPAASAGYNLNDGNGNINFSWIDDLPINKPTMPWAAVWTSSGGTWNFTKQASAYTATVYGWSTYAGYAAYTVNVPALAVPAGATSLTVTGNNTATHTLNWVASNDTRTVGYKIYRRVNNGSESLEKTLTGQSVTTSGAMTGRAAGNTYTYRVVAYNARGDATNAPTVTMNAAVLAPTRFTIESYAPPSTVTVSAYNPNVFTVTGEFSMSGNNTEWGNASTHESLASGATFTYTYQNAPAGTAYFRARFTAPAVSSYTASLSQQTITAPAAPTSLAGTVALAPVSTVNVTWGLTNTTAAPVDVVRWQWSTDQGATWGDEGSSALAPTAVTIDIGKSVRVRLRVRTENAAGVSGWVTSNDYTGFTSDLIISNVNIVNSNGRPNHYGMLVTVPPLLRTTNSVAWRFISSDGAIDIPITGFSVNANGGGYSRNFAYFDAARPIPPGDYKFQFWVIALEGTVSEVAETALVTRAELVPNETSISWGVDSNGVTNRAVFMPATPYQAKREVQLRVWAYRQEGEPALDETLTVAKTAYNTSPEIMLTEPLQKASYLIYEWEVRGYYDNGDIAYTASGEGTLGDGIVFFLNGEPMRATLIRPDGTVTDVYPQVIS